MVRHWFLILLALGPTLSARPAAAQLPVRTSTSSVPGGVAYSVTYPTDPASIAFSVRRSTSNGRWDSVKLSLAREAWSSTGSRLRTRVIVWQELLKQTHVAIAGLELRWNLSATLSATGSVRKVVLPQGMPRRGPNLTFGLTWGF